MVAYVKTLCMACTAICLCFFAAVVSAHSATIIDQSITQNTTWNTTNSPYIVKGSIMVNSATSDPIILTINPGVEVRFDDTYASHGSQLRIGDKAKLSASGTASQKIKFTSNSTSPQTGDWYNLDFGGGLANILENCTVEYGGSQGSTGTNINCAVGSNLTVRNCNITRSLNYGLYSAYGTALFITNNNFSNNQGYPILIPATVVGDMSNNTFSGNTNNTIVVNGGIDVTKNATWRNAGIPYLVNGNVRFYGQPGAPVMLTINPGTIVQFSKAMTGALTIGMGSDNSAGMNAQGTYAQPIRFTSDSATPAPGDWGNIMFSGGTVGSTLKYCTVEYASDLALYIVSNASVTIDNCTIRKTSGTAIWLYGSSPIIKNSNISQNTVGIRFPAYEAFPTLQYNTITANGRGIQIDSVASSPSQRPITIRNNNIYNNTVYNFDNYYSDYYGFDSRLNWWGNSTDPSTKLNGLLAFEPWLNQTFTQPFNFQTAFVSPKEFTQNGGSAGFVASLPASGNWTIELKNNTGTVVRTYTGSGTNIQQNWDGKNNTGQTLPDGNYTYSLRATAVSGGQAAAAALGKLKLTGNLPIAKINSPITDTVVVAGNNLTITGSANATGAATLQSYKLEYGTGLMPYSWQEITSNSTPVINATLASWLTSDKQDPVYTLRLTVTDSNSRTATDNATIRLLNIYDVMAISNVLSPNGDGTMDTSTIQAKVSLYSNWTMAILNATNTTVRSFNGTGTVISQVWDGKNSTGSSVADGNYTYIINAAEIASGTSALPKTGVVSIDTTPPIANISYPANGTFVTQTINVTGTANDTRFQEYILHYGQGDNPSSWTDIYGFSYPVTNGFLGSWDTGNLTDGNYTLRLTTYDTAGNTATDRRTVSVSNVAITGISVNPPMFDPLAAQTVNLYYTIDKNSNITLRIYDLAGNLTRTLINNVTRSAGAQSESWNGRNNANVTVADGGYTLTLEAQSTTNGAKGRYNPADIMHPQVTDIYVTPSYDPYKNELCAINYTLSNASILVLFAQSNSGNGTILQKDLVSFDFRPKGPNTEYWSGMANTGNIMVGNVTVLWTTPAFPDNMILTGSHPVPPGFVANPYCIFPYYGETANITYTLQSSANVSARVYAPGNPMPLIATLMNNVTKSSGNNTVTWDGRDSTGKVVTNGDYSVVIDATTPDGRSNTRAGNVVVR